MKFHWRGVLATGSSRSTHGAIGAKSRAFGVFFILARKEKIGERVEDFGAAGSELQGASQGCLRASQVAARPVPLPRDNQRLRIVWCNTQRKVDVLP
jgi:hypothetical protein